MVKNGQEKILQVSYQPAAASTGDIEVISLAELDRRMKRGAAEEVAQRIEFHQILGVTEGSLHHMVDFAEYSAEPGRWLWVRPGQVQQFRDLSAATGYVVLFQAGAVDAPTAALTKLDDPFERIEWTLSPEDTVLLREALEHLAHASQAASAFTDAVGARVLEHLLAVLLLQLTYPSLPVGSVAVVDNQTFLRFRKAVERNFFRTRSVAVYARRLGYSSRTLTRATVNATGATAKEFIDGRVMLEAKRLLAHGQDPVARIAEMLGFDDASNFVKFFALRANATPAAFRESYRGTEKPPSPGV